MYASNPERVLKAYHKLPLMTIKATKNPELAYYLDKIAIYIHGKLFTFTEQPNFVCLDDYVQKNDTVEINYTIKDTTWTILTTSMEDVANEFGIAKENILAFNAWSEYVLPWINTAVLGTKVGKWNGVLAEPNDAYGSYETNKRVTFNELPESLKNATIGQQVLMTLTVEWEKKALVGVVTEKNATWATIDFNHPHAGKTVQIWVQILKLFKVCTDNIR